MPRLHTIQHRPGDTSRLELPKKNACESLLRHMADQGGPDCHPGKNIPSITSSKLRLRSKILPNLTLPSPPDSLTMVSREKPTLRELAKHLNLSLSTVSMALNDNPRITVDTRNRVKSGAKELGYIPDPRIANVMSYLKRRRPDKPSAAIAYVTKHAEDVHLEKHPIYHNYLLGARERAQELGYRLDYFNMRQEGITGKRLTSVLENRGIEGVLIPPTFTLHESLDLDFKQFACVAFGHSLDYEPINRVSLNHFSAIFQSLVEISKQGHHRIGFAMESMKERVQHRWKAAHLMFLDINRDQERVPALEQDYGRDVFLKWFNKYRPTAILSQRVNFNEYLFEEGLVCGRDYGFATLSRDSHLQDLSHLSDPALRRHLIDPAGLDQNSFYTGRFAVEFLAQQIAHNMKGPPLHPMVIEINGEWHPGKTLPKV